MATDVRAAAVEYPSSDGKPMAETDLHRMLLLDVTERLRARYAGRKDVYVSGNLLVYYVEGNPRVSLAPDCFVVFGVPNRTRRTFLTWKEGAHPAVVIEFTSGSTMKDDMEKKYAIYQDLWQVREYFLFDPEEDYLDPSLLGYRLTRGEFKPVKPVRGVLTSKELGITMARDGTRLVLRDAATGKELPTPEAQKARRTERAARKAQREAEARAAAAEAEVTRLKAELDALRRTKPAE